MSSCEHCGRMLVPPAGPVDAKILLLADAPTRFDVKALTPWTSNIGDLLRSELRRVRINYYDCRVTNMWRHAKHKECDVVFHLDAALAEMEDREAIVLMGANAVTYYTGKNVSDVSGLQVDAIGTTRNMVPPSVGRVYALFNPALATHGSLGEIRHGLEKIAGGIHGFT